jgi:predicted O-methyltransferase YrrM
MLDQILEVYNDATYNFIDTANDQDPLKHLFEEWQPYYKLKWAIANVIKPKRILEIGVRFGYSAMAFLNASPTAEYVGIDANLPEYGGEIGALDWAKAQLQHEKVLLVEENSQDLTEFPGGIYDLIHVDGQQDGDGFYRDMQKAVRQARFILVDGALWTNENALSSISFMRDYKDSIEWSVLIPGYAGELLIKIDENVQFASKVNSSQDIKSLYQEDYYLSDCGGFVEYLKDGGKELSHPRLKTIYMLADVESGEHVLDAGCGRGELAYALTKAGAIVEAVDYSESAIALTKQVFRNEDELRRKVTIKCEDITQLSGAQPFDRIIASDLIEHLRPEELDKMYANFSSQLAIGGELIIHTFPNLWFYKYGYERKRRIVRQQGGFLSPEPRTHYERLMHINEQSPRVLKRQLEKYFSHVIVWFGDYIDPLDSLNRNFAASDCIKSRNLFAIASHSPIDVEAIRQRVTQSILTPAQQSKITVKKKYIESAVTQGNRLVANVSVHNNSDKSIASVGANPVYLSYHWLTNDGKMFHFEGERTTLSRINAMQNDDVTMLILAPNQSGEYRLQITLVQEQVAWFESASPTHALEQNVMVGQV